jgi:glutamate-5-semialdehyde dehydrogenase
MSWHAYAAELGQMGRAASIALRSVSPARRNRGVVAIAHALRSQTASLLEANAKDVAAAPEMGLNAAAIDRLRLTTDRIEAMAKAVEEVAALPDPVGEVIDGSVRPNGLQVQRVRVPLGVVLFIYESRPNVTTDAAALCLKSGNAVILRGGKEAIHSNTRLGEIVQSAMAESGLPPAIVQLVNTPQRDVVGELLKLHTLIDVVIPRGGKSLIERVVAEATMPVLKHYDGICHVYVDASADIDMALRILENSKCQRTGVCNAAECVLVHAEIAEKFLPRIGELMERRKLEVRGCPRTCAALPEAKPASEVDYRTEYLDMIISCKVVDSLEEAVAHIEANGSHHTETIVTNDYSASQAFVTQVDSAAVIVNASTRFNDGGELGLGAEIGISTDKFHARGPCGLKELTSYKYVVKGSGQIRG